MKKIFLSLIIGIFVLGFVSCQHNKEIKTVYFSIDQDLKLKFISANNDSAAYKIAYQNNEISKCVDYAMNDAYKSVNSSLYDHTLQYKPYSFSLIKFTYNKKFEIDIKKIINDKRFIDYLNTKDINKLPKSNVSESEVNKYIKKYDLTVEHIDNKISIKDIDKINDYLYNEKTGIYYKTYNNLKAKFSKI